MIYQNLLIYLLTFDNKRGKLIRQVLQKLMYQVNMGRYTNIQRLFIKLIYSYQIQKHTKQTRVLTNSTFICFKVAITFIILLFRMYGKIENYQEQKGLFTFYKQMEYQEQKLKLGLHQQQNIQSKDSTHSQLDSSIKRRNKNKTIQHQNLKHLRLNKHYSQLSFQNCQKSIKIRQQDGHNNVRKFLQQCLYSERSPKTKQGNQYQLKIDICNQNRDNMIYNDKNKGKQVKDNITLQQNGKIQKINRDQQKIKVLEKNPLKPIIIKRDLSQCNSDHCCTYYKKMRGYNYSFLISTVNKKQLEFPVISARGEKPQICINQQTKIKRKRINDSQKQNRDRIKTRKKALMQQLNLPQVPKSVINHQKRMKKNSRYKEIKYNTKMMSMIQVKNLQSQLIGPRSIPAYIDMNYNLPMEVIQGWSDRKKQIFKRLLSNL